MNDLRRKVRRIEIVSKALASSRFAGEYHSAFKGQGVEFAEVREYVPGDDVRTIDWHVTARAGRPYVKKHVEERELLVLLAVDVSASTDFGTRKRSKRELATELCAVLAFSAIQNNDKVGLLAFSDQIERYVPPRKGRKHVLRVVRELLSLEPQHRRTDIRRALETLLHLVRRRGILFLVSDFLSPAYEETLQLVRQRHDVIAIHVYDPAEEYLPPIGYVAFEDGETEAVLELDTSNGAVRRTYAERAQRVLALPGEFCRTQEIDLISIATSDSYIEPLRRFFHLRARRMHRG